MCRTLIGGVTVAGREANRRTNELERSFFERIAQTGCDGDCVSLFEARPHTRLLSVVRSACQPMTLCAHGAFRRHVITAVGPLQSNPIVCDATWTTKRIKLNLNSMLRFITHSERITMQAEHRQRVAKPAGYSCTHSRRRECFQLPIAHLLPLSGNAHLVI